MRLLIGSPVRQKPQILEQFLCGLDDADFSGLDVSYCFVDDNTDPDSAALLSEFAGRHRCLLMSGSDLAAKQHTDHYGCNEVGHAWDMSAICKIAYFKDAIIEYAIIQGFDALFFIDSDIVLDRRAAKQLLSRNVEIVSNVFWTQWQPNWDLEPQCFWMPDLAMQTAKPFAPPRPLAEARQLRKDFFAKMRVPGLYQVDGLGACTIIRRSALEKGVRFRAIPNLSLMGEDRHFCVRAGALDIPLYFDTVYPVYHIFRETYLDRVEEFKHSGFRFDMCQTYTPPQPTKIPMEGALKQAWKKAWTYYKKLLRSKFGKKTPQLRYSEKSARIAVLLSVDARSVKYLSAALTSVSALAEQILVFDATPEATANQICAECLKKTPYRVLHDKDSTEENPFRLLWDALSDNPPGWVLSLFGDEVLQEASAFPIESLVQNSSINAYYFRRYEMWDTSHYRSDSLWPIYPKYLPYLMRYQKNYPFHWSEAATGASRKLPDEAWWVSFARIELGVKNFHWADPTNRQEDAAAARRFGFGNDEVRALRCASLLDPTPTLLPASELPNDFPYAEQLSQT